MQKKEDLQGIIDTVMYWNNMEKREVAGTLSPKEVLQFKQFKKKKENKPGAKWQMQYHVEEILLPSNKNCVVVRRMEARKKGKNSLVEGKKLIPGRLVVSQDEAFDRINEHHCMSGHLSIELTYNNCNNKYYNITQKMVSHFCKTCPICLEDNPIIPPALGAAKPIYSYAWHDRFQVDLIDMRKFARPNVYGVIQRWIMVVKDHFTAFTALFSIPYKMAQYVAFELEKYFGLVGYPTIFHTDNGNEFVARQILDLIADMNPAIITVTGRPRTPRDQGSVERANQTLKRVIADVCAERHKEGKDDNWTMFLGRIMSQLNTHHTRQANSVESYPTVFGAQYHLLTKTSLAETRKCKTIAELKDLVIDDGHLQSYVTEYYDTERQYTAEEEKELQEQCNNYWIDDDIDIGKWRPCSIYFHVFHLLAWSNICHHLFNQETH